MKFPPRLALLLAAAGFPLGLRADVTLPALLSTHAVLQKSAATRLWGKAAPGETVRATLGGARAETRAGADGRWQTTLDLSRSEAGPFDLVVEGNNKLTVADVVVGEVWLCGGQSNMQWNLRGDSREMTDILTHKLTNPLLRQFLVAIDNAPAPRDDCRGQWTLATPQDAPAFTGVGYFFGKRLQTELGVPVGLVHSSAPGSAIEMWMSDAAFETLPSLNASKLARLKRLADFPAKLQEYVAAREAWAAKYDRRDPGDDPAPFAGPDAPTAGWTPMTLPGKAPAAGVWWLRHAVDVPTIAAGKMATLTLGNVREFVTIYWNGVKVAGTDPANPAPGSVNKFFVPAEQVRPGANVLTLRIFNGVDAAGIYDGAVNVGLVGQGTAFHLDTDWLARAEHPLPALSAEARKAIPQVVLMPSGTPPGSLYNAMLAPLLPFTLRGIAWYQGEANVTRAAEYRAEFRALIEDWRHKWGAELPFYFCQLPNYLPGPNDNGQGMWPELREAQASALALPRTGQAVLIDVGEEGNLHPFNKRDPGERLARSALARTYGKGVVCSGPVFRAMTVAGGKARVTFDGTDGGLVARPVPATYKPNTNAPLEKPLVRRSPGSALEGFSLCGADEKWFAAEAAIDGEGVVVSAPAVPVPVAVRYDWNDNPWGNLYNGAGLPAAPFRTDTQPGLTDKNKY